MAKDTFFTSALAKSQIRATALIKEIFMARNELEACLISSAVLISVTTM